MYRFSQTGLFIHIMNHTFCAIIKAHTLFHILVYIDSGLSEVFVETTPDMYRMMKDFFVKFQVANAMNV